MRADQIAHRRRTLPEAAEVERLEAERKELDQQVVTADTELSDLEREQHKAEADVEQVRTRRERDEKRRDAGQVGSPKELEGLQHEIETLVKRQGDLEEVELEIMERLERAQERRSELDSKRSELDGRIGEVTKVRDAVYADLDDESGRIARERAGLAENIPGELAALYEKLRGQLGGVGAAKLHQRRCEGCRIELDASELARIAAAPAEQVLRCEECRRILIRTPDSGV